MKKSEWQLLTDLAVELENPINAYAASQSTRGVSMDWPAGKVRQDNNVTRLNDITWRAMKRAQIHAIKEPVGVMRQDGKRPDGTTILRQEPGIVRLWS